MIRTALEFIQRELDSYIVERQNDPANYSLTNVVDLQSVVAPDGSVNLNDETHITMMLVGIEEDRREGKRPMYISTNDNKYVRVNPPVELTLRLLFAAHHTTYTTALRDLSNVISFFQANNVFDAVKYPALNASVVEPETKPWQLIERLSFELQSLSYEQQNNLWGMLGGKYIPSAIYEMKMLTIFEVKPKESAPAITEINFVE